MSDLTRSVKKSKSPSVTLFESTAYIQSVTYRYREFPVPGIFHLFGGIGKNWYRKKVSEPGSEKIWYRN